MELNVKKIERERKRLKMTVTDIANKLHMTRQAYYDIIESGSTKLSTITLLAKVLKCKGISLLKE